LNSTLLRDTLVAYSWGVPQFYLGAVIRLKVYQFKKVHLVTLSERVTKSETSLFL
jgi:hypothetical protein